MQKEVVSACFYLNTKYKCAFLLHLGMSHICTQPYKHQLSGYLLQTGSWQENGLILNVCFGPDLIFSPEK